MVTTEISKARLLLVDDDADVVVSLSRALRSSGFEGQIEGVGTAEKALTILRDKDIHVAVIDLSLSVKEGVEGGFGLLRSIITEFPLCRPIVLTGSASREHGIRALHMGAAHFLEKPADAAHLLALIRDSIQQSYLRRSYEQARQESGGQLDQLIFGTSPLAVRLREEVQFAASNNQALLISGETGTGKGLCARAVHLESQRSGSRFVRYQPTFAGPDLVNSDLFGHERGAFTGATELRRGLLTEAQGGTLFLDEVDELPHETQVTLLGVIQERKFRALGSSKEQEANVRLICASNQDLARCVEVGKVRKDFFHRIAHAQIHLPPLRERIEDVRVLTAAFLAALRAREQVSVFEVSDRAFVVLMQYAWPGNIRELEAVIEGAAYRAQFKRRSVIEESDIQIRQPAGQAKPQVSFAGQVEAFKLSLIRAALQRSDGNQAKAAEELELDRSTLRRILAREG